MNKLQDQNAIQARKIKDNEIKIEKVQVQMGDIKQNNEYREEENKNMQDELQALESHLQVLQDQNKKLERELDNFVQNDEQIKEQLRSKSPPKVRF